MFHLTEVLRKVARAVPEREAVIFRDRRFSFADFDARSNRLANGLTQQNLGCHTERLGLENWQSGQDLLAIYLHNGNEYLEAMFGAFKSRMAPFNVNYRYVEEELVYLLNHARPRAIIYHRAFSRRLAEVRAEIPELKLFIEVDDDSDGDSHIPDAVAYEDFLARSTAENPKIEPSPDDLYILYTGGTTGKPKGVLWQQKDIFVSVMGGRRLKDGTILEDLGEITAIAKKSKMRAMPAPPFMHAAGQWNAFISLFLGNTVVIQDNVEHMDADDLLGVTQREKVTMMSIVGDAFAQPLIKALKRDRHDVSSLRFMSNSGAHLSAAAKHQLTGLIPGLRILDFLGSSEGGNQGQHVSQTESESSGIFTMSAGNAVLNEDKTGLLQPGGDAIGWWSRCQYVPLGYLNDRTATENTFVVIDGVRYAIPGDRARLLNEGRVQLLGRDSLVINSGGEKVFVEEVEEALKHHRAVQDALVVGRPSKRWGTEVTAVVALHPGETGDTDAVTKEAAKHIARYKLPKFILFVPSILRHANGKPDYQWAAEQLSGLQGKSGI